MPEAELDLRSAIRHAVNLVVVLTTGEIEQFSLECVLPVAHLRDLSGVLTREEAQIGVLLTMREPTKDMRKEVASAGFYKSPWGQHRRLQILTIKDLLEGKRIDMPPLHEASTTFKKAPRHIEKGPEAGSLFDEQDRATPPDKAEG